MKLELRPSLRQIIAPQLIQSLKMLQMPLLKLEQTLRQELSINPLLEEVEQLEQDETDSDDADDEQEDSAEEVDWDEYLFDDEEGYKVRENRETEESRLEGTAAAPTSLYDHLHEQLSLLKLSERDQVIGEYILGNISPDGYLLISTAEMAEELEVTEEEISRLLKQIQNFDPTGVGARDLRESLLIQLREKGLEKTLTYRLVDEHVRDLEKKSTQQIARLMGVTFEQAQRAMEMIKTLSPAPAYGRFDAGATTIVPDLIVERVGSEFVVMHNDRYVPQLRINSGYRQLIRRGNSSTSDTKKYVRQKLEQARWLLNAINQRRGTMIRVMEAIIDEQREFFEKGPAFLKPLIMEDIAQIVGMNVATISRVSSGKYVQTPLGVFEIKYFFNTGIARDGGEDISKRTVKQRIETIIAEENPAKPYSDQEIYRMLNAEGIKLARRTVTKYREELNIKPARFRKTVMA